MDDINSFIDNFYHSSEFKVYREKFKKDGKTEEEAMTIMKENMLKNINMNKTLDSIIMENITSYFSKLNHNHELSHFLMQIIENIFKKSHDGKEIHQIFKESYENIMNEQYQFEILKSIHTDINKISRTYVQNYFNKFDENEQINKIILANLNYLIKKKYNGDICFAINKCITELYKSKVIDIDNNFKKIRLLCIEENIPFEEIIQSTLYNIEKNMLKQSEIIFTSQISKYQEENKKAMTEYLENINEHMQYNNQKVIKCDKDINNLLELVSKLSTKLTNLEKDTKKTHLELIKRLIEKNFEKLLKDNIYNKIESSVKISVNLEFNKLTKKVNSLESKLTENKNDKSSETIQKLEKRINSLESKLTEKKNDKYDLIKKQLIDIIDKKSNLTNMSIKKIENTLKSISEHSVKINLENEKFIINKFDESIPKITKDLNDTFKQNNYDSIRDISSRLTDLQTQITSINQFIYNSSYY